MVKKISISNILVEVINKHNRRKKNKNGCLYCYITLKSAVIGERRKFEVVHCKKGIKSSESDRKKVKKNKRKLAM